MQKAVELLFFDHLPDKEIAKACGIARATLANWKNLPEFQSALRDYGLQNRNQAYALLESGSDKAVRTLLELLDSKSESTRLKAAIELLRLIKADQPPLVPTTDHGDPSIEIKQFLTLINNTVSTSPDPAV
jgi:HEAT repeat protein